MEQLLINMTKDNSSVMFDCTDKHKVQELLNSIVMKFDENDIKKHEKMLMRIAEKKDNDAGRSRLLRWMSSRKVDPFLLRFIPRLQGRNS